MIDLNNVTIPAVKKYFGNDKEDMWVSIYGNLPDKGVFVDVGAGPNGIQGSNTYYFEQNGWEGLCIDADPRNWEELKKNRKNVFCGAIVKESGDVTLNMGHSPDISGVLKTPDNAVSTTIVPGRTLKEVLEEYKIDHIDLISIDTEGTEQEVWLSMGDVKPKVAIIEFITQGKVNDGLAKFMEEQGYELFGQVGANLIFKHI